MRGLPMRFPNADWRMSITVLVMVALLVPTIVLPGFYFPYVVPRNIFFRVVVELGVGVVALWLGFAGKSLVLRREPIFWALVAFVAAATVSALFSPARNHSLFGDFERMGGAWAWLHLLLFFLLLRTLRDEELPWVLNTALAISLFVAVNGIVEHYRLARLNHLNDPLVASVSSTVGNSGLLAAYLLFGVALALYLSFVTRYRWLYLAAAAIELTGLVFAENRSTVIGLVLGSLVAALIFFASSRNNARRWIVPAVAGGFAGLVVMISLAIRIFPSNAIVVSLPTVFHRIASTDPATSDGSRILQWHAALSGFQDRPLLGYGPENHGLVWSAHFDPGIYAIDTDIYDRTHNQFLEILATTGLVGTFAFLAIWLAIAYALYRGYRGGHLSASAVALLAGLQVAYATYLFFWFVDLNSTMLWILFAAVIAARAHPGSVIQRSLVAKDKGALAPALSMAVVGAIVLSFYVHGYAPLMASRALAEIESSRGSVANTLQEIEAVSESPAPQTTHIPLVIGRYIGSLSPRFAEMRADSVKRRMLDRAFQTSLASFAAEIHRDTLNDRLYAHQASLLMEAESFYASPSYLTQAIGALEKAIDLSPRRIQQRLLLANAEVRDGEDERARMVLADAIKVDPGLGEPRYLLARLYLKANEGDSALAMLQRSLDLGYVGAPDSYLAMGKRLEFANRRGEAAALYSEYLEAKYTEAVWDPLGDIERSIPMADIALAAHLPLLYARASENELAIKSAAALSIFDPSRTHVVDRFVADVGARRRKRWSGKTSLLPCERVRSPQSSDTTALNPCRVFAGKG